MLIDWFTVIAQLINFAILVVALKFLLYDRIIKAMDKRRSSIAQREATAAERIQQAEEELARLRRERRELDKQREEILENARHEAADQRRELLRQARASVDRQAQEWRESLRRHQDRLLADMQKLAGEKAVTVSRRLLADMADRSMEEAMVSGLVQRIGEIPDEDRTAIADSVGSEDAPIVVRSAFELSPASRENIGKILSDLLGDPERSISWEQDPELISGVVVRLGARSVGWTVADYLDDVEREFAALLRSEVEPVERESDE
ncbi:MAG TPA: F0F1 ATP synthase subunit delta [Acidimicrobiia bacterium]|nr:F0F1 ATP synthase subunit delta [Acidimicrobiia bacterium]